MANTVALSEGALTVANMEDRVTVGRLKGLGLNLATLPPEILYQPQDGVTKELHAREGHAVQMVRDKESTSSS